MELREALGDHRHVSRSDLEKAVTAERASPPALQVLRLLGRDLCKEGVGSVEGPLVGLISHG
jgi:hypothetical protein